MKVSTWDGCYNNQWQGLIVPEAFSHPAKFSPGLIQKIYAHCLEQGYLKKGNLVGDCFGGVGCGAIFAAYAGLRWIGVELEHKFVGLARENFMLHAMNWKAHGYPVPKIMQNDSRRFSEIVGKVDSIVTSPPFQDVTPTCGDPKYAWKFHGDQTRYGKTDGQIGNEKSESYWEAMRQVYSECHKALKPGGYLIVVLKSYVKNKKRVPLPMQTLKLLIHLGFKPVERIKAMLVQESTNQGLFGEDVVHKTQRKSFFRRLAENKGSPPIDFEEVLILRKPLN